MHITVGQRLRSVTDGTGVIVIRAPAEDVALTCGGAPMVTTDDDAGPLPPDPDLQGGTLLGKRYENPGGTLELLCTKAGTSSLAVDGAALAVKSAKPLPASD